MHATRHTRDMLRGKAQTVRGIVDPATLGPTLMHEHVLWDITPPRLAARNDFGPEITLENHWAYSYGEMLAPRNFQLHDVAVAIDEVRRLREVGGSTVVELSCGGLKPVSPWQKGVLARPEMTFETDRLENAYNEHTYFSKEAASGGAGVGGGGCGCN